jgi:hypothetical protein
MLVAKVTVVVKPLKLNIMKLSEFKNALKSKTNIGFELPNGELVPSHFHVTEVGQVNKRFIDCGGTLRDENVVNFQLWEANDYDHRLHPEKLLNIIELSESKLGLTDEEIEVEYQGETIGKYGMEYNGNNFLLVSKTTDCLAKDKCGIPESKLKVSLSTLSSKNTCEPGSGCC